MSVTLFQLSTAHMYQSSLTKKPPIDYIKSNVCIGSFVLPNLKQSISCSVLIYSKSLYLKYFLLFSSKLFIQYFNLSYICTAFCDHREHLFTTFTKQLSIDKKTVVSTSYFYFYVENRPDLVAKVRFQKKVKRN